MIVDSTQSCQSLLKNVVYLFVSFLMLLVHSSFCLLVHKLVSA